MSERPETHSEAGWAEIDVVNPPECIHCIVTSCLNTCSSVIIIGPVASNGWYSVIVRLCDDPGIRVKIRLQQRYHGVLRLRTGTNIPAK